MRDLAAIIVHLMFFSIPFLVGWNIMQKRREHDAGDCSAAIVLLLIYLGISSFFRFATNEDLPPYGVTNEGFMFHAEKTYGLKNFYDYAQRFLQLPKNQDNFPVTPQWRYFGIASASNDPSVVFNFYRNRGERLPLSMEIKLPEKEHFSHLLEHNESKNKGISFWNPDMRTGIDDDHWEHLFKRPPSETGVYFSFFLNLICSVVWIFPLAAAAYKAHTKWLFYGLWVVILALYVMNLHDWSRQMPTLQYERCNAQTALAEISKPENQPILSKLLQNPTAVLENDRKQTIIDAPLLCSGKFFTASFLCWDLGKSTYLYYSPTDLIDARLITANYAKLRRPEENFYLVSYPDFARAGNKVWYLFAASQVIAGSLWLVMFIMALKKRRQDKTPQEATEK